MTKNIYIHGRGLTLSRRTELGHEFQAILCMFTYGLNLFGELNQLEPSHSLISRTQKIIRNLITCKIITLVLKTTFACVQNLKNYMISEFIRLIRA